MSGPRSLVQEAEVGTRLVQDWNDGCHLTTLHFDSYFLHCKLCEDFLATIDMHASVNNLKIVIGNSSCF